MPVIHNVNVTSGMQDACSAYQCKRQCCTWCIGSKTTCQSRNQRGVTVALSLRVNTVMASANEVYRHERNRYNPSTVSVANKHSDAQGRRHPPTELCNTTQHNTSWAGSPTQSKKGHSHMGKLSGKSKRRLYTGTMHTSSHNTACQDYASQHALDAAASLHVRALQVM